MSGTMVLWVDAGVYTGVGVNSGMQPGSVEGRFLKRMERLRDSCN